MKGRLETQQEGLVLSWPVPEVSEAAPKGGHSRLTPPPPQPDLRELIWPQLLLDVFLVFLLTLSSMVFQIQLWSCRAVINSVAAGLPFWPGSVLPPLLPGHLGPPCCRVMAPSL